MGTPSIGNLICSMVVTRNSDGLIAVSTHGGGVFSSNIVTGIESKTSKIPAAYVLSQNYPNPFNPTTKIQFDLPKSGNVKIIVYDELGREVKQLVNNDYAAGQHSVSFDASRLASGVYLYRLTAGNFVQTRKMMLMK